MRLLGRECKFGSFTSFAYITVADFSQFIVWSFVLVCLDCITTEMEELYA